RLDRLADAPLALLADQADLDLLVVCARRERLAAGREGADRDPDGRAVVGDLDRLDQDAPLDSGRRVVAWELVAAAVELGAGGLAQVAARPVVFAGAERLDVRLDDPGRRGRIGAGRRRRAAEDQHERDAAGDQR